MKTIGGCSLALAILAAAAGCGSSSKPVLCVPGSTQSCQCVGLKVGVQSCLADGSGFDACQCVDDTGTPGKTDHGHQGFDQGLPPDEEVLEGQDVPAEEASETLCRIDCLGKECGDDGCGGQCGTCAIGAACQEGTCVDPCKASCTGKECGPDACGGQCGTCPADRKICNSSGKCVAQCTPNCAGKACGDDGCGGQCGQPCAPGTHCDQGKCVAGCVPACGNRKCGDDGCGGSCGACPAGVLCTSQGQCGSGCEACTANPACVNLDFESGNLAGWAAQGAANVVDAFGTVKAYQGAYMLQIATGETAGLASFSTCVPAGTRSLTFQWRMASEEFKEYCASSYLDAFDILVTPAGGAPQRIFRRTITDLCDAASCNGSPGCGLAYAGLEKSPVPLDQGDAWITPWMSGSAGLGLPTATATKLTVTFQALNGGDALYETRVLVDDVTFGTACAKDCLGKACGDDGCGGSCGACSSGLTCQANQCVDTCKASCAGKVCGPDACNGTCGTCPDGCTCTTDGKACQNPDGSACGSTPQPSCTHCTSDADCTALEGGANLKCASGVCADPAGGCTAPACCASGQECFDPLAALGGGLPAMGQTTCSCDATHPCLGGGGCYPSSGLCTGLLGMLLCPSGLPQGFPEGMCSDPNSFLGGFP